jgi:uncharacterized protein (DUF1015 family)
MPIIEPFRGLKPTPAFANLALLDKNKLIDERLVLHEGENIFSFMHVLEHAKPAPDEVPDYPEARRQLERLIQSGIYEQDEEPAFYIYEITYRNIQQTGLVVNIRTQDYANGLIKKHEHTRKEREEHLGNFIRHLGADTTPVMLAYRNQPVMEHLMFASRQQKSVFKCKVTNDFWVELWSETRQGMIAAYKQAFDHLPAFYIADGHHRAASVHRLWLEKPEDYARFSAILFPDNNLKIYPFYRLIKKQNGTPIEQALSHLAVNYDIREVNLDQMFFQFLPEGHFLLASKEHTYKLSPKSKAEKTSSSVLEALDVSILQNEILDPVFGINDPKQDPNLEFGSLNISLDHLKFLLAQEDTLCLFISKAPLIDAMFAVADENGVMPPKSTSFEPKMKSGVVLMMRH